MRRLTLFGRGQAAAANGPRGMLLQLHVTERCNLRCAHCYQDSFTGPEPALTWLQSALRQFVSLLDTLRPGPDAPPLRGHVTVTGGEPFLYADLWPLLETLAANGPRVGFALLTNGTFIDEAAARRLRSLQPRFIQVSLEGNEGTHDAIRGAGSHALTVEAIRRLVAKRVPTFISFTAHRQNFREFPAVAELGRRLRVDRVWADRLIPCGGGASRPGLTPGETREFVALLRAARARPAIRRRRRTEIAMHRALQFLGGGQVYRCAAGRSLLTLMPNGDVLPCRRLPLRAGNLAEASLTQIYLDSPLLRELRGHRISQGCEECAHALACGGGLRCLAQAETGNAFAADPGCWLVARGA